jgi:hypothetical protein
MLHDVEAADEVETGVTRNAGRTSAGSCATRSVASAIDFGFMSSPSTERAPAVAMALARKPSAQPRSSTSFPATQPASKFALRCAMFSACRQAMCSALEAILRVTSSAAAWPLRTRRRATRNATSVIIFHPHP